MTVALKVSIPDLAKIQRVFNRAPVEMSKQVHTAISKTVMVIENKVKREAPVNKQSGGGNLRQSVRGSMLGLASGKVEVGVDYGAYVEGGTRPHTIVANKARVLANRRTGQIFGKVVQHPGTKANPFFQRGIDASQGDINAYFAKALEAVFKL